MTQKMGELSRLIEPIIAAERYSSGFATSCAVASAKVTFTRASNLFSAVNHEGRLTIKSRDLSKG